MVSQNNFIYMEGYLLDPYNSHNSMVKLTQKKNQWIIKQKGNRVGSSKIAIIMKNSKIC
jgi:hypothetical protein